MKRILAIAIMAVLGVALYAQPKVIGHRGCRDVEGQYENTISSLKYAYEVGCDAVEFDVQMTKDGKVVVYHGPKIPGYDKTIHQMTWEEAQAVVLPGGFRIPTLEEYFKEAKKLKDLVIVLEVKQQPTRELDMQLTEKIVNIAKECKMTPKKLEYTSFSRTILKKVIELAPKYKTIYIATGVHVKDAAYAKELGFDGISYDLNAWMNRPEIIEQAKKLGIETTVWLTNNYEVIQWSILHGADYISTDFPAPAVQYVKAVSAYKK